MKKATHYRRNDNYFPRTSREAFGTNFYVDNKTNIIKEVVFVCFVIAFLAIIGSFL